MTKDSFSENVFLWSLHVLISSMYLGLLPNAIKEGVTFLKMSRKVFSSIFGERCWIWFLVKRILLRWATSELSLLSGHSSHVFPSGGFLKQKDLNWSTRSVASNVIESVFLFRGKSKSYWSCLRMFFGKLLISFRWFLRR